jgi:hypothetical protein
MNRLLVGLGASVAVIGVVAGITLAVTTLLDVTLEEGEPKPAEVWKQGGWTNPRGAEGVRAVRYPGDSICVQAIGVDAAVETIAEAKLETAMVQVMQHPLWNMFHREWAPPLVDIGCPSGPLVGRPGVTYGQGTSVDHWIQYVVAEPSFYRTFVFIMPLEEIDRLLDGAPWRLVPQEFEQTGGDVFGEVTNAIFVSPEELEDPSFLVQQLTYAIGLEAPY